jgi:lambda family phage portal protein
MIEGGEALALQRFTRAGVPGDVPLKIELREGDHLDASKAMFGNDGARVEQGIEYDASGRRIAYWMFPDHPGGSAQAFGRRFTSVVAHLFERQRVQNRGVPWGVAAMRAMRDFGDWHRAELARKKTEACLAAIVISDDAGTDVGGSGAGGGLGPAVLDADGNRIESFMPGMIGYSHSGRDVKFNQPSAAGGVGEWTKAQMHIIAAGFRVPYALMSGDMREANFSSARVGLNEFRRMVEQIQWMTVIPMFCQPIWDWFILASRTAGLIPMGGAIDVEWAPPRFESVNPKQDAEADLLEVRAGFSTLAQKIAARGYDPEEVLEEWKAMAKLTDDAELVFDSDPRRVSKGGGLQAAGQGAPDTGAEATDEDLTDDAASSGGQTE